MGLTGKGEVVAVSDTGLDTNNCYFRDDTKELPKDGRIDLTQRKIVQYISEYGDDIDIDGHGTHVSGTIAGKRTVNGKGLADGVAYEAKIAFFDTQRGEEHVGEI